MRKLIFCAIAAMSAFATNAQTAFYTPSFGDNWSIGVDGGVTTTLAYGHSFLGDMRGAFGLHIQKQITPVFAVGVEGSLGVNTSPWLRKNFQGVFDDYRVTVRSKTAMDNMYVGAYGSINLFNLFGGFRTRVFDMELVGSVGWGHDFYNNGAMMPSYTAEAQDQNYFVTKAGLNFNFNVSKNVTIALKPSVSFNMTGTAYEPLDVAQTTCAYNRTPSFNLMASVNYNFGPGFIYADTQNQAEIDALNEILNGLRSELDACIATTATNATTIAALQTELDACLNRAPVEKIVDYSNNVRYIYYKFNSSVITGDQLPNVEMIASYLEHNPDATVLIKGYASTEGPEDYNLALSQKRADAVKTMLIKKYGVDASRITVQAMGETDMFAENAWNRVAICLLKNEN